MAGRIDEGGWTYLQTVTWIRTRDLDLVRRYKPEAGHRRNKPPLLLQDLLYPSVSDPNYPKRHDNEPDDELNARINSYWDQKKAETDNLANVQTELSQFLRKGRLVALDTNGKEITAVRWRVIELDANEMEDFTFRSSDVRRLWQQRTAIGIIKQEIINKWMLTRFQGAKDRNEAKPIRDSVIMECQRSVGVKYRQAREAYNSVPVHLKNPRYRVKKLSGN